MPPEALRRLSSRILKEGKQIKIRLGLILGKPVPWFPMRG